MRMRDRRKLKNGGQREFRETDALKNKKNRLMKKLEALNAGEQDVNSESRAATLRRQISQLSEAISRKVQTAT